jgi:hypothetical protein
MNLEVEGEVHFLHTLGLVALVSRQNLDTLHVNCLQKAMFLSPLPCLQATACHQSSLDGTLLFPCKTSMQTQGNNFTVHNHIKLSQSFGPFNQPAPIFK